MSHIEIVDTFNQDGFFVVKAEHFHEDGLFWFMEHYRWQMTEGNIHKRVVDEAGIPVMDNDQSAPTKLDGIGENSAYLPEGRTWKRHTTPHMDDSSIWEVIMSDHAQRKLNGYVGGRDILTRNPSVVITPAMQAGGDALMDHFKSVVGVAVVL
jgi:hypothetical protein